MKRILSLFLCFLLVFSVVVSSAPRAYADIDDDWEDDWYDDLWNYDDSDDPKIQDSPVIPSDDNRDDEDYSISASTYNVSFGERYRGLESMMYVPITIYNACGNTINLTWNKSDPYGVFYVDAPDSLSLAPYGSLEFHVTMTTETAEGIYSGDLYVASQTDRDYCNGVKIHLTGTILTLEPVVTSVTVSPSNINMTYGSSAQFEATVYGDNDIDKSVIWSLSGASSSGTEIDVMGKLYVAQDETSTSLTVKATSVQNSKVSGTAKINLQSDYYTVTTSSNPKEGGTTGGGGTVTRGSTISLLAAPNNGYEFVNWTLNGKVVTDKARFDVSNIKSNADYVANFRPSSCYVKVSINNDKAGRVTESQSVKYGGNLTIYANTNSGYTFDGWYENGKFLSNSTTLNLNNITSNREIKANFVQDVFKVEVQANPANVGVVSGSGSYKKGSNVVITAKPLDGYKFVGWTVNNNIISTDASSTIKNIDRDYVITACFEQIKVQKYNMHASVAGGQGTISPAGTIAVAKGESVFYTIVPAANYEISAVAVDGVQVGAVSSYSFTNINGEHAISVAFTPKKTEKEKQKDVPIPTAEPIQVVKNDENDIPTDEKIVIEIDQDTADTYNEENNVEPEPVAGEEVKYDYDANKGILQDLNLTVEEAERFIDEGKSLGLLQRASQAMYLNVTVHNEYGDMTKETENTGFSNLVCIPNLEQIVPDLFTKEEKLAIVTGSEAAVNINIFNNDDLKTVEDKQIDNTALKKGVKVGQYFEIVMMKSMSGSTSVVTDTLVPMKIVMNVPKELKSSGRQFCVIRAHQGQDGILTISFLEDEDNNPDTITFSTDKFSSYAIGYIGGEKSVNKNVLIAVAGGAIAVAIVVSSVAMGYALAGHHHRRKKRKK